MGKQLGRKNNKRKLKWILAGIVIALLLAGGGIYAGFMVTDITYTGNKHYTQQQMTECIFGTEHPNALIYTLFGKKNKNIPFIQKYDVEVTWPNKMNVAVYEKAIVGYISYMGCNMYFDKDGIVVESSSENYEDVPQITGLDFKSIVLDAKLEVGNDAVFSQILELTQAFDKYQLGVKKVCFDSSYNVSLYMGNVKVMLGSAADCNDKLYALKQVSEKLTGMKGTLHLENYDGTTASIIFKKEN